MLIIGLGNPDRGDDAAGILVARRLAERGIETVQHRGGTLDLIGIWETVGCAVVVDAVLSGAAPGTLHIWDALFPELGNDVFRSSTHAIGLADAVHLAQALDRLPEKLTIYGIEAAQFVPGTLPSSQVLAAVERAVEHIASHFASDLKNLSWRRQAFRRRQSARND
jgi:hydrogenase maturation protease